MMRIMVYADAVVGDRMAAPGIRAFHVSRVLQQQLPDAEVTLAVVPPGRCDLDAASVAFSVAQPNPLELARLAARQDVIVAAEPPVALLPFLAGARVVLDMYSPLYTEWIALSKFTRPRRRRAWLETQRKRLMLRFAFADLILCANERQRDLTAGIMGTLGLIRPQDYIDDPSLGGLIAVAPLGIRPHEPVRGAPRLRGVLPGVDDTSAVLLWNGTIVEWYDAATLIQAMARVSATRDDIKLVFLGTEHPHGSGEAQFQTLGGGASRDAIELCRSHGILDRTVFFNHGWADHATTEQFLLESDIGVSTYHESIETRYSFRVRYLDLFWASLPMICTRGDIVSEMVEERGLGMVVGVRDVDGLASAIVRMADDRAFREGCRAQVQKLRCEYTWERTLRPLIEFCGEPARTPARRRAGPIVARTADWAASQAAYEARFVWPGRLRQALGRRAPA